jgi:hypothetical protein
MRWGLFLNVVVACPLSVCPSSRNRIHGNPPRELSGCVSISEWGHLRLSTNRAYSGGLGSGADEKYESSIASVADGRACRSIHNNFSARETTSGGNSLEANRTVRICSHPEEHRDSLRPFERKDVVVLLRWRHQTVPRCSE